VLGLTVLGSGSQGNALVVHGPEGALLLDAGLSLRELRRRMAAAGIEETALQAVVVSHEHADHITGLGPLVNTLKLPVYCNRGTGLSVCEHRIAPGSLKLFAAGCTFAVGGLSVSPFSIPHDASDPVGFVISADGLKIGVATDLGYASGLVLHHLADCDLLVLECNHDVEMLRQSSRPWSVKHRILGRHGHLSNDACMTLMGQVLRPRTRQLVLAHASRECNRYELIAEMTARQLAALNRTDVHAHVARQDDVLPTLWVG